MPAIFHYQPTPAQAETQTKFYGVRGLFNPVYRNIKPYVPTYQLKQANAYNNIVENVFKALGTYDPQEAITPPRKFGFDTYNRLSLRLGNYTLYYSEPYYYITFYDFDFISEVDFAPLYAIALYFCPDLQDVNYSIVWYNADHLTFIFNNLNSWFPDHDFNMYVALCDEQYFSNFFF